MLRDKDDVLGRQKDGSESHRMKCAGLDFVAAGQLTVTDSETIFVHCRGSTCEDSQQQLQQRLNNCTTETTTTAVTNHSQLHMTVT